MSIFVYFGFLTLMKMHEMLGDYFVTMQLNPSHSDLALFNLYKKVEIFIYAIAIMLMVLTWSEEISMIYEKIKKEFKGECG
jgi:hypothetical protein